MGVNGLQQQQAHQGSHIVGAHSIGFAVVEGCGVFVQDGADFLPAASEDLVGLLDGRRQRADLAEGGQEGDHIPVIGVAGG